MGSGVELREILENFFRAELSRTGFRGPQVVSAFRSFLREIGCPLSHGAPVHAHVYFHESTRAHAADLREALIRDFGAFCEVGPLEAARGPHPMANFEIGLEPELRDAIVEFLCERRGPLSVLVHGVHGHDLSDHSVDVEWLGDPLALNLAAFDLRLQ